VSSNQDLNPFPLVLASASPRRRDILSQIGLAFRVIPANCDESMDQMDPLQAPRLLAERKALAVSPGLSTSKDCPVVLGFDTLVYRDDQPLGKPADPDEAFAMLWSLRNRWHQVRTGYCLAQRGKILISGQEMTEVCFRAFSEGDLAYYIASKEPFDKAGGYGIQGLGARLVQEIRGCYYNVEGLPVSATLNAIEQCRRILNV